MRHRERTRVTVGISVIRDGEGSTRRAEAGTALDSSPVAWRGDTFEPASLGARGRRECAAVCASQRYRAKLGTDSLRLGI
jgi:hypothetical protein